MTGGTSTCHGIWRSYRAGQASSAGSGTTRISWPGRPPGHCRSVPGRSPVLRESSSSTRSVSALAHSRDRCRRWSPTGRTGREYRHLTAARDATRHGEQTTTCERAWPLFRLAQFLELMPGEVGADARAASTLLGWLAAFPEDAHGPVWLEAYEDTYRLSCVAALSAARGGRARRRRQPTLGPRSSSASTCGRSRSAGMSRRRVPTRPTATPASSASR